MKQITDKLFAVEVPHGAYDFDYENGHIFYDMPTGILERSMDLGINKSLEFKIVGTIDKDTIDFDVWDYGMTEITFRSLLASKGCDPNAKHLIIKQE